MVLTRRQEQLLHTPPPPAANGGQLGGEPSPATPAGAVAPAAQANGRVLPLKSALKTGRKLRPSGAGEEESTPVGAGIKKRVRIHSSSNLVHEFTTSHSTDEAAWALLEYDEEEEEHESGSDSERGSADGTPDSGGARRGRTRRRTVSDSPSFLSLLLFGEGTRGRGGARRGGRRRANSGAWLGLLYTLAWMAASSALIFANKVLMVSCRCLLLMRCPARQAVWVDCGIAAESLRLPHLCMLSPPFWLQVDHGFRFPFALTAMGQAASVLLGTQHASATRWAGQAGLATAGIATSGWPLLTAALLPPLLPPLCSAGGLAAGLGTAAATALGGGDHHQAAACGGQLCGLALPGQCRLPGSVG